MLDSREIPRNQAVQCGTCKNHIPYTVTCKAFPNGIPRELLGKWDHREPFPGDNGILYDPVDPENPVAPPHPRNKVK